MQNLDPHSLHREFLRLGMLRHKLMNKMLMILPAIYQSEIYKKYASSIFEYASKFGGISQSAVEKRLRIEKYIADKPALQKAIGEVGVNKVALVATLATVITAPVFAEKLKNMSKDAVVTLAKELRFRVPVTQSITDIEPCQAKPQTITIELDAEMTFQFLKLKKRFGEHMSNREVVKKILDMVENDSYNVGLAEQSHKRESKKVVTGDDSTRYISRSIKNQIISHSQGRCTYPNCNQPAEIFHHTERFANTRNHKFLVHLCKIHHQFMHSGLIENENIPKLWALNINKNPGQIDNLYQKYRQG